MISAKVEEVPFDMNVRRCAILLLEPRERLDFDLESLARGGSGLVASADWIALAPHLGVEVSVTTAEVMALGQLTETPWQPFDEVMRRYGAEIVGGLIEKGLLVSDSPVHEETRRKDERVRNTYWHRLGAVLHSFSRWHDVTAGSELRQAGLTTMREFVERYGTPPSHIHSRPSSSPPLDLPSTESTELGELLRRRITCRNFASGQQLPLRDFAFVLWRVFGIQSSQQVAPELILAKKTSPSGGSLHPIEAYLLVQNVESVQSGLYHYHAERHALEPLQAPETLGLQALAEHFVAGQHYFADAHVLVVLVARFRRNFWKYRNHAKAYRALILDAGHLSQMLYLTATELGLGAYVTAAMNETNIEQALGIDPLEEGPLVVCGFGPRAAEMRIPEFDPQGALWQREGEREDHSE